ncbi:undecaprenyldiphospho-muramoylpentapeptide beta-N-acetylglucosaminyltransferase [Methylocaldum marinum]|uniref:UDP-N-acetylglucosamine--N-acetylmuramyl-(pentapeptide) pyrophosphoryl-undecaprenol N-acetylglucosamine transferase n=2 Tax=Methylocaldum marinum TaxID=1432792 RepID=A0A250KYK6_9GAMM|nr:undecaprenyldiphospho-muramoylpentapeptide beta-N-acetylglucosaminyltransferase [Methylocaldum marinum]BBA36574.1 undecaprenyldiphospho-muramoylpentapeptide beta-N-acetylglucosaminyltransferase [Methylocaldum marinum]
MGARVMIMAGGTGGHVYPALAVARELLSEGHEVVWMGTRSGLEARVVPAADIPVEWLSVSGLRGKGWLAKVTFPFMLTKACLQAWSILRRVRPNVVLGMGGFVSGPGGLMARLSGIPLVLHEQNRIPGTTNRWLAGRAQAVLEAFPGSFAEKAGARCTGNPVRREIVSLKREIGGGWDEPLKILILGGSQGARALNEIVPEALARIDMPVRVFHQTGEAMRSKTAVLYAQSRMTARIESFIEDMAEAYGWADLVVCRAGAMTISELTAAGLPSILIPYPYAIDDHQTHNARYLVDNGAAVMIPQSELSAERLAEEITVLMQEPSRLKAMAERASALAKPDAARVVAAICLSEVRCEAA